MINEARSTELFQLAEKNHELFDDIYITVPARPHDGICIGLTQALSMWFASGIKWMPLEDSMGGFVEVTRTKIALHFLRNRTEKYLLMIDNDTEPDLLLPYLLARNDVPVVGACIPSYSRHGREMLCFSRHDDCGVNRMIDYSHGDKIPATGLAEVPSIGTGAMMIRRDVLESFTFGGIDSYNKAAEAISSNQPGTFSPEELKDLVDADIPFFVPQHIRWNGAVQGVIMQGEDIVFCHKARAKGFKVYADLEAHCMHRKTMKLAFPDELRDPSLRVEDWHAPKTGMAMSE